jgi:hypothetical protein
MSGEELAALEEKSGVPAEVIVKVLQALALGWVRRRQGGHYLVRVDVRPGRPASVTLVEETSIKRTA